MNKWFGILLIIPALLSLFLTFAIHAITEADYNEFEEYRLEKTNNYATDAALQEVLYGDDLEQDYIDTERVTVNPDTARDTYLTLLSLSYDIPVTQDGLKMLGAEYLDVFIVAAYDGYYSYSNEGLDYELDGVSRKDYSPYTFFKVPYIYEANNQLYSYDMKFETAYHLLTDKVEKVDIASDLPALTKDVGMALINKQLNKEINTRLELMLNNGSLGTVMVPEALTTVGSVNNRVENVSVLAFVNNVNLTTTKRLNAFSIGGARIKPTRMVACYIRNGKKYYAYADRIYESSLVKPDNFNKNRVNDWVFDMVNTFEEAAALGYSYDMAIMEGE